jgi:hypothetical protein
MIDSGFVEMKLQERTHVFPRLAFFHVHDQKSRKLFSIMYTFRSSSTTVRFRYKSKTIFY